MSKTIETVSGQGNVMPAELLVRFVRWSPMHKLSHALLVSVFLAGLSGINVNVLFPNTWVTKAGLVQLSEYAASLKKHPPIPTGTLDPYEPPK